MLILESNNQDPKNNNQIKIYFSKILLAISIICYILYNRWYSVPMIRENDLITVFGVFDYRIIMILESGRLS